jgi:transcriptional regulator with XRE-family HTH domain
MHRRKNYVREMRVMAGLSQAELARRSGCNPSAVARLDLNPCARVPADIGFKLATALSVPLEALIADEELVSVG